MESSSISAYLFLTPSIVVTGGAELYMFGKSKWLQERGWDVYIAGPCCSAPVFDYGVEQIFDVRLFNIRPFTLSRRVRKTIVEPIIARLKQYEHVFVESSTVTYGFWGEYIASLLQAPHLLFHLSECAPVLSRDEREFLIEKHRRGEFFCINERIFQNITRQEADNNCVLVAKMPRSIQDVNFDASRYPKRAFRIGCISRLDKPFLYNCVKELADYPADIELVVVGGVSLPDQNELELRNRIVDMSEGHFPIMFTGALSPVPSKLVDTFDFGVGKAGGAVQLLLYGIPTFVYSVDSDEPKGMLGFDYNRMPTSHDLAATKLSSALNLQYEGQYYTKLMKNILSKIPDLDVDYSAHFDAFQHGDCEPVLSIKNLRHRRFKEWAKGILCTVLGPSLFMQLIKAIKGA